MAGKKYRQLQGTWPVIAFSFARIKESTYADARKRICQIITDLYNKYDFLLDSGRLNQKEKDFYGRVSAGMEEYVAAVSSGSYSEWDSGTTHPEVWVCVLRQEGADRR